MIIDVHTHVLRWPILKKTNNDLRFMSPEEQVRRMDEKGIDKAVILPLNSAEVIGEHQSMGPSEPTTRARDERHAPGEFAVRLQPQWSSLRLDCRVAEPFRPRIDANRIL